MNTAALRAEFDRAGFVACPRFRDESSLAEIRANLDRVMQTVVPHMPPEHVFREEKSDLNSLKQLQRLDLHDAYFGELMASGPFRSLAEQLLGGPVSCQNLQYFNKPPGLGKPTPPHQDGFYFKLSPCEAITLWLALDPVDAENGCVRYIPGSHRRGLRPHGPTGTLGFSQGILDFPTLKDRRMEIEMPAAPGDLLAHHALTIHRADGNTSRDRPRRALGWIYYHADAQQDQQAWQAYQTELNRRLASTGRI